MSLRHLQGLQCCTRPWGLRQESPSLSLTGSDSSRWSKNYRAVDGEKVAVGWRSKGEDSQTVSGGRMREILSSHQELLILQGPGELPARSCLKCWVLASAPRGGRWGGSEVELRVCTLTSTQESPTQMFFFIYILGADTQDCDLRGVVPTSAGLGRHTSRCFLNICDKNRNSFPCAGVCRRPGSGE